MITPEVQVVLAWHAALNEGEVDRLVALSTDDVEVGGPRGVSSGAELLREWVARARVRMEPLRWQAHDRSVVVLERAQWQTPDGQLTDPQEVASAFRVQDGRVSSVIRYADLEAALAASGLTGAV